MKMLTIVKIDMMIRKLAKEETMRMKPSGRKETIAL